MNRLKIPILSLLLFLIAGALSWSMTGFPGLAFAAVVATILYSAYHDEESSAIAGAVFGLLLDFLSPEIVGINAFSLAFTGFIVSVFAKFFHFHNFVWFFVAGVVGFTLRSVLVSLFHLVARGEIVITGEFKGIIAAALWSGIAGALFSTFLKGNSLEAKNK